jgi:orotidine-5'-phosphate decarboxylase
VTAVRPELAIAFDVATLDEALALEGTLGAGPEWAKVGLQLFAAAGPEAVRALARRGRRVFLDLKLHDIPNTVAGAAESAARLGAGLLTVHAAGGEEMVRAAVEGIGRARAPAEVVAVTLLTSLDPAQPPPGFVRPLDLAAIQSEMLALAERAGAKGVVCSAADLPALHARHPAPFFAVTPGIRPAGGAAQDQKRVATIAQAVAAGAGLLVLGRAVTAALDPAAALRAAREELARGVGPALPASGSFDLS